MKIPSKDVSNLEASRSICSERIPVGKQANYLEKRIYKGSFKLSDFF